MDSVESEKVSENNNVSRCDRDESFEKLLQDADSDYKQCDYHVEEMMIKTVACISCQVLVCPLCLCGYHQNHEVVSLVKLRECKSLRGKLDDDLNNLQVLQERLQNQLQQKKDLESTIEESSKELKEKLHKAFIHLHSILTSKEEEINKYVLAFSTKHLQLLKDDIILLEQRYTNSNRMIQKVISFSTAKMGSMLKESQTLPEQLKLTVKQSQLLKCVESPDSIIPGRKFAKIIPSLEALCNICETIHPEATKVVWSKVSPEKKKQFGSSKKQMDAGDSKDLSLSNTNSKRKRGGQTPTTPKRQRPEKIPAIDLTKSLINGDEIKTDKPAVPNPS